MSENLKKFLEFVGNDPTLIEKAKQLKGDDPEKAKEIAITFAKENGFELTEADFEAPEGELSADELSAVAGGTQQQPSLCSCSSSGHGFQNCICAAGGGGQADENGDICACVGYGSGSRGSGNKCTCVIVGIGEDDDI